MSLKILNQCNSNGLPNLTKDYLIATNIINFISIELLTITFIIINVANLIFY